jgi:23S rRNA (pseudouridine1915-N3)-methyltransferase
VKLLVLAIGDKLPAWAETAVSEYRKRLPREARLDVIGLRPERRSGQPGERIKAAEAARLLEKCPRDARLVALDEHGKGLTTRQLASEFQTWSESGRDTVFLLGGADGLAPEILARAELVLALSPMTLPHALARVVLVEQLYRAWSLLAGHPYHRE